MRSTVNRSVPPVIIGPVGVVPNHGFATPTLIAYSESNHPGDVKEYYFYLDSTPRHARRVMATRHGRKE